MHTGKPIQNSKVTFPVENGALVFKLFFSCQSDFLALEAPSSKKSLFLNVDEKSYIHIKCLLFASYTNETKFYLSLSRTAAASGRKKCVISSIRFKIHSDFPNATTYERKVSRGSRF